MRRTISAAQSRTARLVLWSGFGLLLVLWLVALWSGQQARESEAKLAQVGHLQAALTQLVFDVQQAESAQRGFLLTADPRYRAPFQQAASAVPELLSQLSAQMGETTLQPLVTRKMAELNETLALADKGDSARAMALVRTNAGLTEMAAIDLTVHALRQELEARERRIGQQAGRNLMLFELGAMLGVAAAVGIALLVMARLRRQTEMLLGLNEDFRRIYEHSSDIFALVDGRGRLSRLNPAWTQITGLEVAENAQVPVAQAVHPDEAQAARELFSARGRDGMQRLTTRLARADGGYACISWHIVPIPDSHVAFAIGRDVTEERAREEQLRQSQKMEIIGQLTGGIAHDFNNLLTVIMGSLEMLQRGLADADAKLLRRIEAAMDGGRRAASLTHRLLAFARRQPLEPKEVEPNKLLAGMSEMLHRTLGEHIALELVCAAGLWRVLADGHQLENAILNLAVNARDAMPGGGHLTIETQNMALDDDYAAREQEVRPGQYVLIAVTDTGIGMTPEVVERVFEPFFTTKPVGQGTGLGLAQVYGFIKQSSGHVKIYSEPGQGTSVKLYLPRLSGSPPAGTLAGATPSSRDFLGQGETILLVEDEDAVRHFTAELLQDLGYNVIAMENAAAAMPVITSGQQIDLLFTDIVLTGAMNGRQLADSFQQRRPQTPVLFTTGYTRNAIIHHGRLDEGIEFIGKPFTATALAQKLHRILRG